MSHILKNPLCPATQVMGKDQHQGRGNPTFYEYNNLDGLVKNVTLALLSARKLDKDTSENLLHNMQSLKW